MAPGRVAPRSFTPRRSQNPGGEKVLDSCKPDPGINHAQIHIDTENIALGFFQQSLRVK
jgi:hypothetical protein